MTILFSLLAAPFIAAGALALLTFGLILVRSVTRPTSLRQLF